MTGRSLKALGLFATGIALYNYLTLRFSDELFILVLFLAAITIYLSEKYTVLPKKIYEPSLV